VLVNVNLILYISYCNLHDINYILLILRENRGIMSNYKIVSKGYEPKKRSFWVQVNLSECKFLNLNICETIIDDLIIDRSSKYIDRALDLISDCLENGEVFDGKNLLDYFVLTALKYEFIKNDLKEDGLVPNFYLIREHFEGLGIEFKRVFSIHR
jgi:hypothetical protein